MTREEHREYQRKYRAEHREERREYMSKRLSEHREEYRARKKKYYAEHRAEHKKYYAEHREEHTSRVRKRQVEDLNQKGITKNQIRIRSRRILKRNHTRLPGYEIHHCFGYEDPGKFIYIPRELHIKIHQFLRDNNIPADIDHFNSIRELISSYTGYTYIHS